MSKTSDAPDKGDRALVTVFENDSAAEQAVQALRDAGFGEDRIEFVRHHVDVEAPEIDTPKVTKETEDVMLEEAGKWAPLGAGVGAATGLLAGVLTPFPGAILPLFVAGGLIGGGVASAVGGVGGIEHAGLDDSVNLPKIKEYQELVDHGHTLVVVRGTHDELMRAEEVIGHLPFIHNNIHPLHGHEFHEHPAKDV